VTWDETLDNHVSPATVPEAIDAARLAHGKIADFFLHPLDQESLGERVMSGVQATGSRSTTELPLNAPFGNGRAEHWVSPELKLVVYFRSEEPDMGTFEYQLTRITHLNQRMPELVDTCLLTLRW
jgi:hypothetical protein